MTPTDRLPALAWILLISATLLHLGLGLSLGLSGDEAHYALYAAHLALSYYDHPPMVGWIQWPLVALGLPDGALRLVPHALWLLCGWLVYDLARSLHTLRLPDAAQTTSDGAQAGMWALGLYCLSPLLHVLGIGLLPDTLLMTLTALLMRQTLRLLQARRLTRMSEWLWLGLWLGLAGLSKYTAIFAALPVALTLLAVHGAGVLRLRGPWMAVLLAAALVLPVFVWNARNDWISFAYQLHHGKGSHWQWRHVGLFALAQLLLYGPLFILGGWGLKRAGLLAAQSPARWLLGFFACPFLVLMFLSGGGSGLPHWTAPAWVAGAPFAGLGLFALWRAGRRRLIRWLAAGQALLFLGLFALMLGAGPPGVETRGDTEPLNPFTDFHGWEQLGGRARALAQERQVPRLAVQNWTLASRLAWYARPVPVHVLDPGFDQFSLWSGDLPQGADALVMDWSQMAFVPPAGEGQFQACDLAESMPVVRWGRQVASFRLYHCRGWGGKPAPRRVP